MTSDGRTLKQLSEEATPGPLRYTDIGAAPAQILSSGGMTLATFYGLSSDQEALALARLAVELVNAYREGRLVEAPERELCTACALPCDRYGCDCIDLAACNAAKLISPSSPVSSLPTREDETE